MEATYPGHPSSRCPHVPGASDGNQSVGLVPRGDLDVSGGKRPSRCQAAADDAMGNRRGKSQEVAPEVDGDPVPRARVRDGVPAGRVDARREGAAVEKGPRPLASERAVWWIEPQNDGVGKQLCGNEPDRGVER